jgi:uncharacterized protein
MPRKKSKLQAVAGNRPHAPAKKFPGPVAAPAEKPAPPQVSGRWLLLAVTGTIAAAALCAWGALCLLFWQGNWQLLYHPAAAIARTPAAAGLAFDPIGFATTPAGVPRLSGWWISAASGASANPYTVLYLHDQDGNLSGAVDHLAQLHAAGVNVFAFDYRGYGQSQFAHPSEKRWLEDATWAWQYLTATRHVDPHLLVVDGTGLGADLALELAASHPELAGVVIESPLDDATSAIFNDGRAQLVPAHLLAADRWDLPAAAEALHVPSLWFLPFPAQPENGAPPRNPAFFEQIAAPKMFVWLPPGQATTVSFSAEFSRWLDSLKVDSLAPAAAHPPALNPAPQTKPAGKSSRRRHRKSASSTH